MVMQRAQGAQTQNKRGEWVTAIPLPLYLNFRRAQCNKCGDRFRSETEYRGHYALVHILGLD